MNEEEICFWRKEFQSPSKGDLTKIPIEDFHKWALLQSKIFPDMLNFNTEEEILDMFYKVYHRKRVDK